MQSEIDSQKMKIKGLEDILKRYREEDEIRNRKAHDMIKEVFKPSQVLNNIWTLRNKNKKKDFLSISFHLFLFSFQLLINKK